MREYKLVASDLDGTLLNSSGDVSKENLSAIAKLNEKGINFVISTGRTFSEIPEVLKKCPAIRYYIYSNGAVVYDKVSGYRILSCISGDTVRKIFDIVKGYDAHLTIRYDGCAFVDKNFQSDYCFDYYNVCEAHIRVVRNFAVYSDEFEKLCYSSDNVEAVSVFFHNYEDKIKCREKLSNDDTLRIVEVDKYNIEIVNTCAGKGNALRSLADMMNIDLGDIISVGDSDNDKSSIMTAGLGLATYNSTDDLKNAADGVICSNDENIAEYVLFRYF